MTAGPPSSVSSQDMAGNPSQSAGNGNDLPSISDSPEFSDQEGLWSLKIKQLDETDFEMSSVSPTASVRELKSMINDLIQLPIPEQRMIFRGKVLENSRSLREYSVTNNSCIHLLKRAAPTPPVPVDPSQVDNSSRDPLTSRSRSNDRNRPEENRRSGFQFDPAQLNRIITEQLGNTRRTPRSNRRGRPFAVGDNLEHIHQTLASLDTLTTSISDHRRHQQLEAENLRRSQSQAIEEGSIEHLWLCLDDSVPNSGSTLQTDEENLNIEEDSTLEEKFNQESGLTAHAQNNVQLNSMDNPENPTMNEPIRRFQVGQWIDVLDTVNQWLEATVVRIGGSGREIHVHYNGWGDRWDETIDANSPRIARFRTKTRNSAKCKNICPTLQHWVDKTPTLIPREQHRLENTIHPVRSALEKVMEDFKRIDPNCSEFEGCDRDRVVEFAPRLDLMGRALMDMAAALANRPGFRRRFEVLSLEQNLISLVRISVLPMGLKASVERDRSTIGSWNRREWREALELTGLDDRIMTLTHAPHQTFPDNTPTRNAYELHLHAILAPDVRPREEPEPTDVANSEPSLPSNLERGVDATDLGDRGLFTRRAREGAVADVEVGDASGRSQERVLSVAENAGFARGHSSSSGLGRSEIEDILGIQEFEAEEPNPEPAEADEDDEIF